MINYATVNSMSGRIAGSSHLTKQRKKGRPRSENPMVHTAVVLPRDLLEMLRSEAAASDRGISAVIREALQLHYLARADPEDFDTLNLLSAIKLLSEFLARDMGTKWHQHPYALAAFKAGVEALLARYRPEGDARVRPDSQGTGEPDDPPDVVGRTHARRIGISGHPDDDQDDWEPPDYRETHDREE
jgi:hypothetical protein